MGFNSAFKGLKSCVLSMLDTIRTLYEAVIT